MRHFGFIVDDIRDAGNRSRITISTETLAGGHASTGGGAAHRALVRVLPCESRYMRRGCVFVMRVPSGSVRTDSPTCSAEYGALITAGWLVAA